MESDWDDNMASFLELILKHGVRMIMVGDEAVNFYGYKKSSSQVDFWIEASSENFNKLLLVLKGMGSNLANFPAEVFDRKKNISINFSNSNLNVELITNFVVGKSFSWAYEDSIESYLKDRPAVKWRVLSLEDLLISKAKSLKPQDILDVQELKKINGY
ncbi:MAG TPA: hypothetical protein VKX40_16395 [Aequorivita sp.]|nr:hypothetical protein [Aequorivita sp.]